MMKTETKQEIGKRARIKGAAFELKTRKDLESKGYIVDKWSNNIDKYCRKCNKNNIYKLEKFWMCKDCGKIDFDDIEFKNIIKAKYKMAGPKILNLGTGFPDFIALKRRNSNCEGEPRYEIIAVECKVRKYLDKVEKEKIKYYLKNNIFSKIYVAYPEKKGRKIIVKYKELKL